MTDLISNILISYQRASLCIIDAITDTIVQNCQIPKINSFPLLDTVMPIHARQFQKPHIIPKTLPIPNKNNTKRRNNINATYKDSKPKEQNN